MQDAAKLRVYKRDDFHHIPFAGMWDFRGGGWERDEAPEQFVLREINEEFVIALDESRLIYKQKVANYLNTGDAYFFAEEGRLAEIETIVFGSEGQYWQVIDIDDFLANPLTVAVLKNRLQLF